MKKNRVNLILTYSKDSIFWVTFCVNTLTPWFQDRFTHLTITEDPKEFFIQVGHIH